MEDLAGKKGRLPGDFLLFWFSIRSLSIWDTISRSGGSALDATARITDLTSLPLHPEQWKVEVTLLFETLLARTAFNARAIARGTSANHPNYTRQNVTRDMCDRTYLFDAPGWKNVNGMWYLVILIPCSLIVIAAIPIPRSGPDGEETGGILFEALPCAEPLAYHIVTTLAGTANRIGLLIELLV